MNRRWSISGGLMFVVIFLGAYVYAATLPPKAQLMGMLKGTMASFRDAVKSNDMTGFVAGMTPESQKVFTPDRFKTLFHQFFEQKLTLEQAVDRTPYLFKPPAFDNFGDVMLKGFYILDGVKDNLITFEVSYHGSDSLWKVNGFGLKAFPVEAFPGDQEFRNYIGGMVKMVNAALSSGDFTALHGMLAKDQKKGMTPESLKKNFSVFVDKKMFAPAATIDDVTFDETPELIGKKYFIVKCSWALPSGSPAARMFLTLSSIKEEGAWKINDIRIQAN